jgi:hypothetical protein
MSQKAPERQASRAQAEQTAKDEWTRTDESQEHSTEGSAQAVASPIPLDVSRTDPTADVLLTPEGKYIFLELSLSGGKILCPL